MQGQHFTTGATVYDSAGKKVGTLHAYNPQSGFLAVRMGWLLRKDRYIHRSAVSRADAAGVALQLSKDDLKALVRAARKSYGRLDIFCSNAGIAFGTGVHASGEQWERSWSINVMQHVYAAQLALPAMARAGSGYLLITASAAGPLKKPSSRPRKAIVSSCSPRAASSLASCFANSVERRSAVWDAAA